MAGMLVAHQASISPEMVDAVCAAPAWKTFTSHVYLNEEGSLDDDEILLAQRVAKTLIERIGEAYPGNGYKPITHRADGVLSRCPGGAHQDSGRAELMIDDPNSSAYLDFTGMDCDELTGYSVGDLMGALRTSDFRHRPNISAVDLMTARPRREIHALRGHPDRRPAG